MKKRFKLSKEKNVKKWIKGDRGTMNITNKPIYNTNMRGGIMLT